ncbi:MAG: hypothetical protein BGO43_13120 [Gammaproteobacteria bacterium 39-13]|nr:endonuclease [Gammaproteobacteria bacterium]OJV92722.1 MAG: hypothetical protein BGO43_13120 [Gammaproteobacteria bacterium 39-13]
MSKLSLIFVACFLVFINIAKAEHPKNFQESKKIARIIWASNPETIYCGCKYDEQLNVDHQSCGYEPREGRRANRVEWEHLVPASWLGKQRECWREPICEKKNGKKYKGRKCCEKIDSEFRKMHTDLHNIVPAIGEVNQARNDYRFGEFYQESREQKYNFHGCKIIIDTKYRVVEPRDEVKGMIARAHLYLANTYSFKLSANQEEMFKRWNKTYPPSDWEVKWNMKVKEAQGNDNIYISKYAERCN